MVQLSDIALAIASFGPAMALLYFTLRRYTFPKVEKPFFDDRKIFAMLTFGIILGMIFFFLDSVVRQSIATETILLIAVIVPLLQSLIKLAILNWPKMQRKVDTAFYGLALGLGIAATYSFSEMYYSIAYPAYAGLGAIDAFAFLIVVMMGISVVLIQGSTTAMIAVGCARGQPWTYFGNSMIYALTYSFLLYGSALAAEPLGEIATVVMVIGMWGICIYSYWHVWKIDYPQLIIDAKRGFKKPKAKRF